VIAALGLVSLVQVGSGALTHIIHGIGKALPAGSAGVFTAAVHAATTRKAGSTVAVVLGILVALWSATGGTAALLQALDIAYELPYDQSFLKRRVRAAMLMALTAVLGLLGAALIVFGQPIGAAIEGVLPVHGLAFSVAWTVVRWLLTLIVISVLFSAYYFLGPNRERPHWRWVSPGSLLATAIFLLASLGFSYYVSAFGSYGKTYGSFAGVAIFIFWLYLVGLAVLLGAELNAEIERRSPGEPAREADSATARGRHLSLARRGG